MIHHLSPIIRPTLQVMHHSVNLSLPSYLGIMIPSLTLLKTADTRLVIISNQSAISEASPAQRIFILVGRIEAVARKGRIQDALGVELHRSRPLGLPRPTPFSNTLTHPQLHFLISVPSPSRHPIHPQMTHPVSWNRSCWKPRPILPIHVLTIGISIPTPLPLSFEKIRKSRQWALPLTERLWMG